MMPFVEELEGISSFDHLQNILPAMKQNSNAVVSWCEHAAPGSASYAHARLGGSWVGVGLEFFRHLICHPGLVGLAVVLFLGVNSVSSPDMVLVKNSLTRSTRIHTLS